MIYTIQNEKLTVQISDHGAELQSIKDAEGGEWLWQGDERYWEDRAPILFPFCGRFWNGLCTVDGVPYDPGMHGFLRHSVLEAEQRGEDAIAFILRSDEESLKKYPFAFEMKMCYELVDNRLVIRAEVTNTGDRTLPYGYGGHPGFCVQYAGGALEDYYVCFPGENDAKALCFDPNNCFLTGGTKPFPMRDGNKFDLNDAFFETGSSFLIDMPKEITLKTDLSEKHLTMRYEGFPYLGFWKAQGGKFICIEPWTSMCATWGENTEFNEKPDLVRVAPGETKKHEYSVEICY